MNLNIKIAQRLLDDWPQVNMETERAREAVAAYRERPNDENRFEAEDLLLNLPENVLRELRQVARL